jgi:hypothetical protein
LQSQRSSIAFIISSAHLTASAIAATVAGHTLPAFPLSQLTSGENRSHHANDARFFATFIHRAIIVYLSPLIRYGNCASLGNGNPTQVISHFHALQLLSKIVKVDQKTERRR